MGDVRIAARENGMSVEQFFFESDPNDFVNVDWNDDRPTERLDDRLERLMNEMNVIAKYGYEIPDRLLQEYYGAMDEWVEQFEQDRRRMEEAPIGCVDDYATEEDIKI